jgi:hypothetical protein
MSHTQWWAKGPGGEKMPRPISRGWGQPSRAMAEGPPGLSLSLAYRIRGVGGWRRARAKGVRPRVARLHGQQPSASGEVTSKYTLRQPGHVSRRISARCVHCSSPVHHQLILILHSGAATGVVNFCLLSFYCWHGCTHNKWFIAWFDCSLAHKVVEFNFKFNIQL